MKWPADKRRPYIPWHGHEAGKTKNRRLWSQAAGSLNQSILAEIVMDYWWWKGGLVGGGGATGEDVVSATGFNGAGPAAGQSQRRHKILNQAARVPM